MTFPHTFRRWQPHPWHGLQVGRDPPRFVHAYIEITPFDLVKYEIDKVTGYPRVDRPQRTSSQPPALYGFIPRTYCGGRVSALCTGCAGGDSDPLDVCVVSEQKAMMRNSGKTNGAAFGIFPYPLQCRHTTDTEERADWCCAVQLWFSARHSSGPQPQLWELYPHQSKETKKGSSNERTRTSSG